MECGVPRVLSTLLTHHPHHRSSPGGGGGQGEEEPEGTCQHFSVLKITKRKETCRGAKGQAGPRAVPPHLGGVGGEKRQERESRRGCSEEAAEPGLGCGEYLGHQGAYRPDHRETYVRSPSLPPALPDRHADPNTA